jgi:hypothetical protein
VLVSLIFKTPLITKKFGQWKLVKDAPKDIFGRHEMKLGTSKLRRYNAN